MEVYNNNGTAGEPAASRSYSSIATVNRNQSAFPPSTEYGTTYNEFKFTDTAIPTNVWSLEATKESSLVETQIDYGYGVMDDKNPEGGYVSQFIPKEVDVPIPIECSPIIEFGDYTAGDIVSTLMVPKEMQNASSITIGTSDNTTHVKLNGERGKENFYNIS